MLELPENESSILKPDGFKPVYPELKADIQVDTAVVGGGITGLTTAYLLKKAGQKVAVLEKDALGSGTTGHTTGKVTSQHNLMYANMRHRLGAKKTKQYGQANQAAVQEIDKILKKEKIETGWERADNYVYTAEKERVKDFKDEAKVAAEIGLPASFVTTSPLPFKITAAVKFANQAHFSAQKYVEGLAKIVHKDGSFVYEKTRATGFKDGMPCIVKTPHAQVIAKNIVVATNVPPLPLAARVLYCLLEYPTTSYLVAGRPKLKLSGMYISPDEYHYSLLPIGKGDGQILLIGGNNHIRGLGQTKKRQQMLANYASEYFGVNKIEYRWQAWDYIAYDGVPLVGKLYPWSKHLYVATAFKKWGLSNSYVAATILRDLILDQKNELTELYSPQRPGVITSIPAMAGGKVK